jgi:hypothetical protein
MNKRLFLLLLLPVLTMAPYAHAEGSDQDDAVSFTETVKLSIPNPFENHKEEKLKKDLKASEEENLAQTERLQTAERKIAKLEGRWVWKGHFLSYVLGFVTPIIMSATRASRRYAARAAASALSSHATGGSSHSPTESPRGGGSHASVTMTPDFPAYSGGPSSYRAPITPGGALTGSAR